MKKIVIIGAGISGLTAGWYLQEKGYQVTLLEKEKRAGGWIRTVREDGFLFELGPRGFRPTGKGRKTLALVDALGLSSELLPANPDARKRYVAVGGKLCALSPRFLLRQGVLGALLRDMRAAPLTEEDMTVADFCRARHFPSRLTRRLVDPLLKGIFGGESETLSLRSTFPTLWEAARKGSLLRHLPRSHDKAETPLYSFRNGMETLPRALAERMKILYGISDLRLVPGGVELPDQFLPADQLLVATPPYVAAALAGIPDPFTYTSLTSVNVGWRSRLPLPRGFGFLLPSEEKSPCLGMTWDSTLFPGQNQGAVTRLCIMMKPPLAETIPSADAPYHSHTTSEKSEESGKNALALARQLLSRYLHLELPPDTFCIREAKQALPHYRVGHHQRVEAFKSAVPFLLLGNGYGGISINDCISKAMDLAHSL